MVAGALRAEAGDFTEVREPEPTLGRTPEPSRVSWCEGARGEGK